MIDIHTHILPGVDDGAEDLEQAVEMLRMAAAAGSTPVFFASWRLCERISCRAERVGFSPGKSITAARGRNSLTQRREDAKGISSQSAISLRETLRILGIRRAVIR